MNRVDYVIHKEHELNSYSIVDSYQLNSKWIITVQSDGLEGSRYSNKINRVLVKACILYSIKYFDKPSELKPTQFLENLFNYIKSHIEEYLKESSFTQDQLASILSVCLYNGTSLYYGLMGESALLVGLESGHTKWIINNVSHYENKSFLFNQDWIIGEIPETVQSYLMISANMISSFEPFILRASKLYSGIYLPLARTLLQSKSKAFLEGFINKKVSFEEFLFEYEEILKNLEYQDNQIELIINSLKINQTFNQLIKRQHGDRSIIRVYNDKLTINRTSLDQYLEPNWKVAQQLLKKELKI